jgi:hypothetical protein
MAPVLDCRTCGPRRSGLSIRLRRAETLPVLEPVRCLYILTVLFPTGTQDPERGWRPGKRMVSDE